MKRKLQYKLAGIILLFSLLLSVRPLQVYGLQQSAPGRDLPENEAIVDSLLDASWANRNIDIEGAHADATIALRIASNLEYTAGIARSYYLLGLTDQRVGSHEEAMQHFLESLEMEQERGDKDRIGKVLNGIAILYYRQENYDASIDYFERAVATLKEAGNAERAAISIANVGLIYYNKGQFDNAFEKYSKALETFRSSTDNQLAIHVTLSNIGNVLMELGQYDQAEEYHREALAYFEENELIRNQSEVLLNLSKLSYQAEGNAGQAIAYAEESLNKALSINFKESIVDAYEHMADVYEQEGEYDQALAVYKNFKAVEDSLLNSERIAKIEEMQTRFDVQEKNRQIELLNKETALKEAQLDRQKLWRMLLFISIGLLAVIIGLMYRFNNQKKTANTLLEHKNRQIEESNRELTQLNEEKSEFMGMAAHDLRNPLSGIKSVISMVQYDDDITKAEMEEYLQIIDQSSNRMLILINNLLDVNAIEEGGRPLELYQVEIDTVISKSVQNQKRSARAKDITINTESPDNLDTVEANPEALQRVLENLISNAIKYSPIGTKILVASNRAEDKAEIKVSDNGPGIPAPEQDQLFRRFSEISTQPTGSESSTGLGLFVVKHLMEKMNGSVRYEENASGGASFIISLPVTASNHVLQD